MNKLIKGLFGLFVLVSVGEIQAQTLEHFRLQLKKLLTQTEPY